MRDLCDPEISGGACQTWRRPAYKAAQHPPRPRGGYLSATLQRIDMNMATVRASFFDASAMLKRYIDEDKSDVLRRYWDMEPTRFTSSFCFYEALTRLKAHFRRRDPNGYKKSTVDLCAWFSAMLRQTPELNFTSPEVFFNASRLAEKHALDLSDALQILTLQEGYYSRLINNSRTILVTADRSLVRAARAEGLRVWNLMDDDPP
jgi:predicted nucleic acid-binding protein